MSWDGLDRRKFPRIIFPCLVTVYTGTGENKALLSHTENVGVGGLCVVLKSHIDRFTNVELAIDLLDMQESLVCEGKVVWNVRRKEADVRKPLFYDIGIEFVNLKSTDEKRLKDIIGRLMERKAAPILKPYL